MIHCHSCEMLCNISDNLKVKYYVFIQNHKIFCAIFMEANNVFFFTNNTLSV